MVIREDDEARRGTNHGAGCIKTYTGDDEYKGDHHGEILEEEKNDKWYGDVATAIVEGMYSRGNEQTANSRVKKMDIIPRTIRIDSTAATRS